MSGDTLVNVNQNGWMEGNPELGTRAPQRTRSSDGRTSTVLGKTYPSAAKAQAVAVVTLPPATAPTNTQRQIRAVVVNPTEWYQLSFKGFIKSILYFLHKFLPFTEQFIHSRHEFKQIIDKLNKEISTRPAELKNILDDLTRDKIQPDGNKFLSPLNQLKKHVEEGLVSSPYIKVDIQKLEEIIAELRQKLGEDVTVHTSIDPTVQHSHQAPIETDRAKIQLEPSETNKFYDFINAAVRIKRSDNFYDGPRAMQVLAHLSISYPTQQTVRQAFADLIAMLTVKQKSHRDFTLIKIPLTREAFDKIYAAAQKFGIQDAELIAMGFPSKRP